MGVFLRIGREMDLTSFIFICLLGIYRMNELTNNNISQVDRQSKVNLFTIVKFPNQECVATGTGDTGTCNTQIECESKGGISEGSCAQGFGICCVIYNDECGTVSITANRTYIRNPDHPSGYSKDGTCMYSLVKSQQNICQMRLDFVKSSTTSPTTQGKCEPDYIKGYRAATGRNSPKICGENAGQHIYLDAGAFSSSNANLEITLGGSSNINRHWKALITQIECDSPTLPPPGCLQYHTGQTGQVRSFNFDAANYDHLNAQIYSVCIRREKGFCSIGWLQSVDPDSFKLSRPATNYASTVGTCSKDYVNIFGGTNPGGAPCKDKNGNTVPSVDRFCGGTLNCNHESKSPSEVVSSRVPFQLGVNFRGADNA